MKRYIILVFICVNFLWSGLSVAYDGLSDVEIHGFVAQGFLLSDKYDFYGIETEKGTFEYSSAGINFSSNVYTDLRIGAQLLMRDYGELGNDQIELDWAYGDYRVNNYLGVRGGKVKVAMGLYNETRDIDSVRTSILLPNSIYLEHLRDVFAGMKGIGVYGEIPGGLSYQATYGVVPYTSESYLLKDIDDSLERKLKFALGPAGQFVEIESTESKANNNMNFALQWAPHFVDGLRFSGTYYGGEAETLVNVTLPNFTSIPAPPYLVPTALVPNSDPNTWTSTQPVPMDVDEVSSTVISAEYVFGDTILSAEYNMIKVDIDRLDLRGFGVPYSIVAIPTTDVLGWAVSASHRFKDRFEIGMYYSDYVTDIDDANGKDWERDGFGSRHERYIRDACLSTRVDITEGWICKLEGHLMRGLDEVTNRGGDNDPTWYLYAAKVSYNF